MERAGDLFLHKRVRVWSQNSEHARPQEKEPTTFVNSENMPYRKCHEAYLLAFFFPVCIYHPERMNENKKVLGIHI